MGVAVGIVENIKNNNFILVQLVVSFIGMVGFIISLVGFLTWPTMTDDDVAGSWYWNLLIGIPLASFLCIILAAICSLFRSCWIMNLIIPCCGNFVCGIIQAILVWALSVAKVALEASDGPCGGFTQETGCDDAMNSFNLWYAGDIMILISLILSCGSSVVVGMQNKNVTDRLRREERQGLTAM